jgi:Transposase zinc-binding domain
MKVMSAIERCRTAALGGHVERCEKDACGHTAIAYNRFYEASGGERMHPSSVS